MATTLEKAEQRVILQNVSWRTYQDLLADCEDRSSPRLTYDRGVLEIMSPSAEHEEYNRTISMLVEVVAEELSIDVRNLGSTTFKREEQLRGTEPEHEENRRAPGTSSLAAGDRVNQIGKAERAV